MIVAPISVEEELVGLKEKLGMQKANLRDTEIEIEEADAPRVPAKVYTPSPAEYDKHCATHLPYRNWCPICVQAKRKNPAPKKSKDEDKHRHIPVISMDYMYLNEKSDEANCPILVIHDSHSEGVWAVFSKRKGDNSYVIKRVIGIIKRLGYSKIVLKSDQEPALRQLEENISNSIWIDVDKLHDDIKRGCGCQIGSTFTSRRVGCERNDREHDPEGAGADQSDQVGP